MKRLLAKLRSTDFDWTILNGAASVLIIDFLVIFSLFQLTKIARV